MAPEQITLARPGGARERAGEGGEAHGGGGEGMRRGGCGLGFRPAIERPILLPLFSFSLAGRCGPRES